MSVFADTPVFTLSLSEAIHRSGYSERQLRRLKDAGKLRAARRHGRLLFAPADVDALTAPQASSLEDIEVHIADLVAQAPVLSEARRARIAAALASASSGGAV
ncbi:hypothetical protein [Leucobacter chromiireducens]|uniref:DNA-binding protein n=1 Tax=Leucobacter chromiireducens subsp. chromiireducens TaxID=660067 RepID=A0ABS1SRY7_9MICO|nr:hypothetical protein [Leucobacter chromiireducens]MBL3690896.1 DNA-binding protein [Leucobacter chromiireducens subsp. chromiireducens]